MGIFDAAAGPAKNVYSFAKGVGLYGKAYGKKYANMARSSTVGNFAAGVGLYGRAYGGLGYNMVKSTTIGGKVISTAQSHPYMTGALGASAGGLALSRRRRK
jgi:homoaconitase/3-isopropylmalate dehydratase large subunit